MREPKPNPKKHHWAKRNWDSDRGERKSPVYNTQEKKLKNKAKLWKKNKKKK